MVDEQQQSGWKELLNTWANLLQVGGGLVAVLSFIIWTVGLLSGPLALIFVSVALTLLFVGLWAHLFMSSRRPIVSIGELMRDEPKELEEKPFHRMPVHDLPARALVPIASTQKTSLAVAETHTSITQKEHNLISLGAKPEILVEQNHPFRELRENDGLRDYSNYTIVIEFENKPVPGCQIHPLESVAAQIFFYDADGKERRYIERGAWVGEWYGYTTFNVGNRKKLVVAFNSNDQQDVLTWVVNNNREESFPNLEPSYFRLTDKWLRVCVRLIAQGEIIREDEFTLTTDPDLAIEPNQTTGTKSNQTEEEAHVRKHVIEQLRESIDQEYTIITSEWSDITLAMTAPMIHSERVKRFLADYADYLGNDAIQRYQEKHVTALEEMLNESLRKS